MNHIIKYQKSIRNVGLAPRTPNHPFNAYNPMQRRNLQDINPLSVTLLEDAAHAMNPILGLEMKNAFKDHLKQASPVDETSAEKATSVQTNFINPYVKLQALYLSVH
uniref:Uncharacterized protein n=1 Tax=Rhizophagus irregularis (strain DAOM 181602 / DAOM 197198 / MUCL 43194) TaxID=747089 RepID=U9TW38_RHIID